MNILRIIWDALRGKSQSDMEGSRMEWQMDNFRKSWDGQFVFFDLDITLQYKNDHSPCFSFFFCVFNFIVFDISYVNAYHIKEDNDAMESYARWIEEEREKREKYIPTAGC
jgi:hypothetical protein